MPSTIFKFNTFSSYKKTIHTTVKVQLGKNCIRVSQTNLKLSATLCHVERKTQNSYHSESYLINFFTRKAVEEMKIWG